MPTVVGVAFKKAGKIYYFDPAGLDLKAGDKVIVKTSRGTEFGEVAVPPSYVPQEELSSPLKKVVRKATKEDEDQLCRNREKEKEALEICGKKIEEHGLAMKLIDAEYVFDDSKLIFLFTAEGRVDFRELVKDLASAFRTRIELRQIGVRDEAKIIGGLGPCGRRLCCTVFLGNFEPVSIRMAKEQDLPLNPLKISGICGRLMCCLKYEYEVYRDFKKRAPRRGTPIETPYGAGKLVDYSVPREVLIVELESGQRMEVPLSSWECSCETTCLCSEGAGEADVEAEAQTGKGEMGASAQGVKGDLSAGAERGEISIVAEDVLSNNGNGRSTDVRNGERRCSKERRGRRNGKAK